MANGFKTFRKSIALVLSMVIALAMGSVAYAASSPIDSPRSSDTGSITIHDLAEGVTANAYQIAKATYDEYGNFLGYEMTVTAGDFVINSDGSYDEDALTEGNLAALYAALNGAAATGTAKVDMGASSATIKNLPVGSYLIVITNSESVSYGMMIGSVSYTTKDGDWAIDSGTITDVKNCELWAKSTTPIVEKTEHHTGGSETHGESSNAGDEITFDITISNIPSYQGEYPEFELDDVLTGLTVSEDELADLTVTIVNANGGTVATLTKDVDYTVTHVTTRDDGKDEFDVNFVVNGKYTLNGYAGQGYSIVIEYQATVIDSEAYQNGEAEHENDATLTYATTSYVNRNDGETDDSDYEYTFSMNIHKTDGSDPLPGAVFGLYTDETCATAYTQEGTAVTAESGENGIFTFTGLAEGTYYMKESQAPADYLLNTAVYKVVISATYKENGSIDTWSIVITLGDETITSVSNTADTGVSITNTKAGLLPSMGGNGTMIFTLIGLAIVICAVVGVVVTRKKRST